MAGVDNKYLAFVLGDQEFAADIACVREIRSLDHVARIPDSPAYLLGIMDLRGRVVPVVDLRRRFHLGEGLASGHGDVVVVADLGTQVVGLVVDRVQEVLSLSASAWEPPPPLFRGPARQFLSGVADLNGRLIVLLDLARVLSSEEVQALQRVAEESPVTGAVAG